MFTVYLVQENADLTEGRGPMVTIGAFADEDDAWKYADTHGRAVMGCRPRSGSWRTERYPDVNVVALHVAESYEEQNTLRKDQLCASGLKKLTVEERTALGL